MASQRLGGHAAEVASHKGSISRNVLTMAATLLQQLHYRVVVRCLADRYGASEYARHGHRFFYSLLACPVHGLQWCLAIVSFGIDLGSAGQQRFRNTQATPKCRIVQRYRAIVVPCVNIRLAGQQQTGDFFAPFIRRPVQSRHAIQVCHHIGCLLARNMMATRTTTISKSAASSRHSGYHQKSG
jgi:hypothetical protein